MSVTKASGVVRLLGCSTAAVSLLQVTSTIGRPTTSTPRRRSPPGRSSQSVNVADTLNGTAFLLPNALLTALLFTSLPVLMV